uniref:Uncharacterized protein n=1 Tax=Musa acuminata subsp. malaccensis TaxID=214687 RepID=A0A804JG77_MUSAM
MKQRKKTSMTSQKNSGLATPNWLISPRGKKKQQKKEKKKKKKRGRKERNSVQYSSWLLLSLFLSLHVYNE